MIAGVADTHVVIWYLDNDQRLSTAAGAFIDGAAGDGDQIGVSPITVVEAIYLAEKGRVPAETLPRMLRVLRSPDGVFVEVPFNLEVAQTLGSVDRSRVPDMPDRIVAATALHLRVPIISRDSTIQVSGIDTIW